MEARTKIGVVIFDRTSNYDPDGENPGYCCLPGKEPLRIYGTGDLATDVKWLTNINLDVAYSSRLQNSPKLLNTNFLRTSVNSILVELGLKNREPSQQAYLVANVFCNVMKQAQAFFGIDEPPVFSLAQAIPSQLGHRPRNIDKDVSESSLRAIQSFGQCEAKPSRESIFTSVLIPRHHHALNVLGGGLPYGEWKRVEAASLPPKPKRPDWIRNLPVPALCRVKIDRVSRKYNPLVNYGAGAGLLGMQGGSGASYSVPNDRVFACTNEIEFLSEVADISIEDTFVCEEPVEHRYPIPVNDRLAPLSYSYGILLENMWTSLDRDFEGKKQRSPMAAWLHATDRIECLKKASELHGIGYTILSYGYGRITLALEPRMKERLVSDCQRLGLVPPLGVGSSSVVVMPDEPSGDDLLIGLFAQANLETILDLDNQFTEKSCVKSS